MSAWKDDNFLKRFKETNSKINFEEVSPEEVREKFGKNLKDNTVYFICDILNHQLRSVVSYSRKKDRSDYVNSDYIRDNLKIRIYWIADDLDDLAKYENIIMDLSENSSILDKEETEELLSFIEKQREKYF